jgi:hypothetical protein
MNTSHPAIWIDDNTDPELAHAWQQLADPVMEHEGETWQYMGTWNRGNGWEHNFRHRCHPATNGPAYVNVPARPGWPQT